ncbi:MAG TPA: M24 family metallopeptidase [Rectinemataceae bacterium]
MFDFNPGEIAEKKRRLRSLLDAKGLSAIYLKKSANFAWATAGGYSIVGLGMEAGIAGLLFTRDKEYLVCNTIEAPRLVDEEGIAKQGYEIISFPWYEDREAALVAELSGGSFGADMVFPGGQDISAALNPLRYSLTPWEVERLKAQALDTARIAEETALTIRPGDEERAVVGRLSERLWAAGMDFIVAFCAADDRIGLYRHPVATDRKIEKRAMISVNSRRRGLIVSLTRFVQFGKLPARLAKLYEDTVYVDSAMMAATRPGRPASEVFAAALEAYAARGYPEEYKLHHQGGSIGYFGRDYKVTSATKDIIQENQAFTWNPSITGMKSEDTILATVSGPMVLSTPVIFPEYKANFGPYAFSRPGIMEL